MTEINATVAQTVPAETRAKMRKSADDFESFYLFQVLELMEPETDEKGLFGGGYAEETFRHELNSSIAKEITEQGGIGVSDYIYGQLIKMQENTL